MVKNLIEISKLSIGVAWLISGAWVFVQRGVRDGIVYFILSTLLIMALLVVEHAIYMEQKRHGY